MPRPRRETGNQPAPTFIIFGSTVAFGGFDAAMEDSDSIMGAMNAQLAQRIWAGEGRSGSVTVGQA